MTEVAVTSMVVVAVVAGASREVTSIITAYIFNGGGCNGEVGGGGWSLKDNDSKDSSLHR
jgi:hypothetical protein